MRSLPDPAAGLARGRSSADGSRVASSRATVAKPDYAPSDIVRRLPDPAILTDHTGRIVAANDGLEQVFGIAEPRKHLASVIRAPQVLGALDLALAGRGAQRVEFPVVATPDQMFEAYITPIEGEDRTLRAALIVLARSDEGAARGADARRFRRQRQPRIAHAVGVADRVSSIRCAVTRKTIRKRKSGSWGSWPSRQRACAG